MRNYQIWNGMSEKQIAETIRGWYPHINGNALSEVEMLSAGYGEKLPDVKSVKVTNPKPGAWIITEDNNSLIKVFYDGMDLVRIDPEYKPALCTVYYSQDWYALIKKHYDSLWSLMQEHVAPLMTDGEWTTLVEEGPNWIDGIGKQGAVVTIGADGHVWDENKSWDYKTKTCEKIEKAEMALSKSKRGEKKPIDNLSPGRKRSPTLTEITGRGTMCLVDRGTTPLVSEPDMSVRAWALSRLPSQADVYGDIPSNLTFNDVWQKVKNGMLADEAVGIGDSEVRDVVMYGLSIALGVEYSKLYDMAGKAWDTASKQDKPEWSVVTVPSLIPARKIDALNGLHVRALRDSKHRKVGYVGRGENGKTVLVWRQWYADSTTDEEKNSLLKSDKVEQ